MSAAGVRHAQTRDLCEDEMDRLLTTEEAAGILLTTERTMERWRYTREGPTYIRVGKRVRYREADLARWIEQQAVSRR